MSPLLLQTAFALILILCVLAFILRFNFWKRLSIPYMEPCYICGHRVFRKIIFKSYAECLDILYRQIKVQKHRFCGFFQFQTPLLMVVDPELIERVLVKDFQHFSNHHEFKYDANHIFSYQLYSVNDSHWKTLRRQMSSMFSATTMRHIANRMGGCTEKMTQHFMKQYNRTWVDVQELAIKFNSDLIGRALGVEVGSFSDEKTPILEHLVSTFKPSLFTMLSSFCFIFYPSVGHRFGVLSTHEHALLKSVVVGNVRRRLQEGRDERRQKDLFDFMMDLAENLNGESTNSDGGPVFNIEDLTTKNQVTMSKANEMILIGQLMWTLMDAVETNSGPLSFCFHLLSLHPEHQHKMKIELDAAFEKHRTKLITDDVLKDLKHTEKVVKEALRLYPALMPLVRICTKEYKIPGSKTTLPVGTLVVIPIYSLHLDSEHHSDPFQFRPDRFDEENSNKMKPFTYLPFGNGPRSCFGARYAMMTMKLSVASVVSQFEMKPINAKSDVVPLHPLSPVLLRPREPIFVRFTRRENQ